MDMLALGALEHNTFQTRPTQLGMSGPARTPEEAAQEFEAVYLSTIFNRMFASIETDGPFGGGQAESTWRSFLADEYAGEVARNGGIGLSDQVRSELIGVQEKATR